MIVLFRKANGFMQRSSDLFEWQPEGSRTGKWYTVNRRNIIIGQSNPKTNGYVRDLFNAALLGLVCRVHAKYRRRNKTLELEIMGGETVDRKQQME